MAETPKNTRKDDRRILRTRSALRSAFRALIKEKPYEEITIEELTERANVGRTTFYLHYRDKESLLLEDFEKVMFAQAEQISPQPLVKAFSRDGDNIVGAVLALVHENADLFQAITSEQSNKVFRRFHEIHTQAVARLIQFSPAVRQHINDDFPLDFILNYYSGALWSCIVWWIEQDFQPDIKQVTDSFLTLFVPGLLMSMPGPNHEQVMKYLEKVHLNKGK